MSGERKRETVRKRKDKAEESLNFKIKQRGETVEIYTDVLNDKLLLEKKTRENKTHNKKVHMK